MTATMPAATAMKPCRLYRFHVAHPVTGVRVLGYVGETWQMPFDRLMQHVRDQPWADTMLGWELDPTVYYGKTKVLEAEAKAIRAEKPLYNVRGNERNRQRIDPPLAIRQRRARDAANRAPRWVHPDDRTDLSTPLKPDRRVSVPRQWSPWQVKTGLWSTAWFLTTGIGWAVFERHGSWPAGTNVGVAAGIALLLLVWSLAGAPLSARQWRRVRRRGWRRWMR